MVKMLMIVVCWLSLTLPPPPPSQVPFKYVDDLASVWCEWAEMELRHQNFKRAIDVLKRWAAGAWQGELACCCVCADVMMCIW